MSCATRGGRPTDCCASVQSWQWLIAAFWPLVSSALLTEQMIAPGTPGSMRVIACAAIGAMISASHASSPKSAPTAERRRAERLAGAVVVDMV